MPAKCARKTIGWASPSTMCNDLSLDNELTRAYKKMCDRREKDDDNSDSSNEQEKLEQSLSTEQGLCDVIEDLKEELAECKEQLRLSVCDLNIIELKLRTEICTEMQDIMQSSEADMANRHKNQIMALEDAGQRRVEILNEELKRVQNVTRDSEIDSEFDTEESEEGSGAGTPTKLSKKNLHRHVMSIKLSESVLDIQRNIEELTADKERLVDELATAECETGRLQKITQDSNINCERIEREYQNLNKKYNDLLETYKKCKTVQETNVKDAIFDMEACLRSSKDREIKLCEEIDLYRMKLNKLQLNLDSYEDAIPSPIADKIKRKQKIDLFDKCNEKEIITEKIIEKEVPIEKIVIKEIIIEKIIEKEIPIEKIIEKEIIIEKIIDSELIEEHVTKINNLRNKMKEMKTMFEIELDDKKAEYNTTIATKAKVVESLKFQLESLKSERKVTSKDTLIQKSKREIQENKTPNKKILPSSSKKNYCEDVIEISDGNVQTEMESPVLDDIMLPSSSSSNRLREHRNTNTATTLFHNGNAKTGFPYRKKKIETSTSPSSVLSERKLRTRRK